MRRLLVMWLIVFLLLPLSSCFAHTGILDRALALITQSALVTDRLQTRHWVRGTPANPVTASSGWLVYETNPLLAGRPGEMDGYFNVLEKACQSLETMNSKTATIIQFAWAVGQTKRVVDNNVLAANVGLPQYWVIAYHWCF